MAEGSDRSASRTTLWIGGVAHEWIVKERLKAKHSAEEERAIEADVITQTVAASFTYHFNRRKAPNAPNIAITGAYVLRIPSLKQSYEAERFMEGEYLKVHCHGMCLLM